VWKTLRREGISQKGCATAEEFNPQITQIKRIISEGSKDI